VWRSVALNLEGIYTTFSGFVNSGQPQFIKHLGINSHGPFRKCSSTRGCDIPGCCRPRYVCSTTHPGGTGKAKTTAKLGNSTGVKCPSTPSFAPISAGKFFDGLNPGWNLGNTLDATPTEGSWNNPAVVGSTFDDIKKSGYKSVRLPITYAFHFTGQSPDWTVDPKWLQRVEDVVDMVLSRGFYAIVNVHHDSTNWLDLTNPSTNVTMVEEKMYKLWYQIGTKLACKSNMLAMEPINEIPGTTAEHGATVNRLNNIFLQAINDAGGFNPKRVVTLVGAGEDGVKTTQWFKRPDAKFKNPWGIQYHYYSPCKLCVLLL
jgi:endoglucanase